MKKIFNFLFLFVTCLSLFACGEKEPEQKPDSPEPEITKQEKTIDIDATAWEQEMPFVAKENWRATGGADWLSFSPAQGTAGSPKLMLKVSDNYSTEERSAVISIETISNSTVFFVLTITQKGRDLIASNDENPNAPEGMKKNAQYLVKQIGVGWNLGNTLEASPWNGYNQPDVEIETAWGNPKTTREMFTALKEAGFNAIRIPTRWYCHADEEMNINEAWMARVKEIVDYAVSQDMYVVLNSHHDNWYDRLPVGYNEKQINERFEKMWTQIATAFRDYDEHLIFAGVNEVIRLNTAGGEDWGAPTVENIAFLNGLMQTFVNTVRATGGNNLWRCLMVQPWAASPANALKAEYKLPEDKTADRLIQEFHCYDPYNYAIGKDITGNQYAQHEPSKADLNAVANLFKQLDEKFTALGVPCIMAEFGSTLDNNHPKDDEEADRIRADYHRFMVSEARRHSIPGFYWDNGAFSGNGENFGLLDRQACTFPPRAQIALKGIMDGLQ